ncbi:MAG: metallophosphoesterase family protein, partial [Clostridiales bacterium]
DKRMVYVTHGHIHNEKNLPPLNKGDILLHGHTHLQAMEDKGDYIYINPGSVSIPKGNDVNSYMIYENGTYTIKDFNKNPIKEISISS